MVFILLFVVILYLEKQIIIRELCPQIELDFRNKK